jgi:hypothetical protein
VSYQCWAWVETADDGREGIIAATIPSLPDFGTTALVNRSRSAVVDMFGPIAWEHARRSGHAIRLVRLVEAPDE